MRHISIKVITSAAIAATFLLTTPLTHARRSIDNPVTKAVIEVYNKAIEKNPNDYMTRMLRANEYYNHGEYIKALEDLNQCIGLTPGSDKDTRFELMMLRAGLYRRTHRDSDALPDLNEAVSIRPNSIPAIYQRASVLYLTGNFAEAKNDYKRILALNPRSAEGLLGLAMIAIKENNLGMAGEYLEQAVNCDPNNADIYVRRASVKKQMGDHNGAVEDLIVAISNDSHNNHALEALTKYAEENYPATITGLTNAIKLAPDNGLFRYLRAGIAQAHYNYLAALDDYEYIISHRLYDYAGLYGSMAECLYALGCYDEALDNVDRALTTIYDRSDLEVLKSKILRAQGHDRKAVDAAAKALATNRQDAEGLAQMGLAYMSLQNFDQANELFGEAMLTDGEKPYFTMLRAWNLDKNLNQSKAADNFYRQIAGSTQFAADDIRSYKGFAMLFTGNATQGEAWIDNILTSVDDPDGRNHYLGACFYCAKGDLDKALELAKIALDKGYANYHDWTENNDARINVAPLRDDLRFLNLLNRYSYLFKK